MNVQAYNGMGITAFAAGALNGLGTTDDQSSFGLGVNTRKTASSSDSTTASVFAQDIVSRIAAPTLQTVQSGDDGQSAKDKSGSQQDQKSTDALATSLENAVDTVRDEYGDKAATAVMALVYQSVGDGPVTEDNLGQGLLNALKLMDQQFGTAAGDKLMAQFNTGVNKAMNDYFDNGLNETFYAASGSTSSRNSLTATLNQTVNDVAAGLDDEASASVLDILEQSLEESGLTMEGLRQGVDAANQWLGENRPDAQSLSLRGLMNATIGAAPAKGSLLDVAA